MAVGTHLCRIRPLYADTDAAGVVYYGTYLRYLEEARTQAVESVGLSLADEAARGVVYSVTHVDIDYQSPVPYGSILVISTEVAEVRRVRFRLDHKLQLHGPNTAVGRATVWLASVDLSTRRPVRLPPTMAAALTALRAEADSATIASPTDQEWAPE